SELIAQAWRRRLRELEPRVDRDDEDVGRASQGGDLGLDALGLVVGVTGPGGRERPVRVVGGADEGPCPTVLLEHERTPRLLLGLADARRMQAFAAQGRRGVAQSDRASVEDVVVREVEDVEVGLTKRARTVDERGDASRIELLDRKVRRQQRALEVPE